MKSLVCLYWMPCLLSIKLGIMYQRPFETVLDMLDFPFKNDVSSDNEDEPLAELAQCLGIVSEVINSNAARSNSEGSDDELEIQPITQAEALKGLNTIRCFLHIQRPQRNILKLLVILKT